MTSIVIVGGILVNAVMVAVFVGRYKEIVDRIAEKFDEHMEEYNDFRRRYAAKTGDSNGH